MGFSLLDSADSPIDSCDWQVILGKGLHPLHTELRFDLERGMGENMHFSTCVMTGWPSVFKDGLIVAHLAGDTMVFDLMLTGQGNYWIRASVMRKEETLRWVQTPEGGLRKKGADPPLLSLLQSLCRQCHLCRTVCLKFGVHCLEVLGQYLGRIYILSIRHSGRYG